MESREEKMRNRKYFENMQAEVPETDDTEEGEVRAKNLEQSVELEIRGIDTLQYVTRVMLSLGMPAHLRGYHYLREAICMSIEDMELVGSVTKLLYPEIAKRFRTSDQKVERAIRNIIEVSWERGNESLMEDMFGYSRVHGMKRPTNSEFIAAMADKIRMELGYCL